MYLTPSLWLYQHYLCVETSIHSTFLYNIVVSKCFLLTYISITQCKWYWHNYCTYNSWGEKLHFNTLLLMLLVTILNNLHLHILFTNLSMFYSLFTSFCKFLYIHICWRIYIIIYLCVCVCVCVCVLLISRKYNFQVRACSICLIVCEAGGNVREELRK